MAIQVSIDRDRDEFAGPENEKPEPRRLPRPQNLVPGGTDDIIAPTPFGELNDVELLQPPPRERQPRRFAQTTRGGIVGGRGVLGNRPPRTSDISPGTIQSQRGGINIASPEAQQNAARNSVTARNRGELRDADFDTAALGSAGIAGLDENAVAQDQQGLSQITFSIAGVPGGVAIPNFANKRTADAANRFNAVGSTIGSASAQRQANADPTRAKFQTQFQRGETLKDVGGIRKRARSRFSFT